MNPENRFITRGIEAEIPHWLRNLMWFLRDSVEIDSKDHLQVFRLTKVSTGQHIVHIQEQPPYRRELSVPCEDAVTTKVYIIDDETHVTMLLASEY